MTYVLENFLRHTQPQSRSVTHRCAIHLGIVCRRISKRHLDVLLTANATMRLLRCFRPCPIPFHALLPRLESSTVMIFHAHRGQDLYILTLSTRIFTSQDDVTAARRSVPLF